MESVRSVLGVWGFAKALVPFIDGELSHGWLTLSHFDVRALLADSRELGVEPGRTLDPEIGLDGGRDVGQCRGVGKGPHPMPCALSEFPPGPRCRVRVVPAPLLKTL